MSYKIYQDGQPFSDFEVFPNYYDGFTFTWMLDPSFVEDKPWFFTVQESSDSGTTWEDISDKLENVMTYQDGKTRRYDKDNRLVYRVKLEYGGNAAYSVKVAPYAMLDLISKKPKRELLLVREIMRKENLMMEKMSGVPIKVWRRDPFKRLSGEALDPLLGTVTDPDTDVDVMYYGPYDTFGVFTPAQRDKEQNQAGLGYEQKYNYQVRLLGFPYINEKDIIVDTIQDRRYYVDAVVDVAELRRFPIIQTVVAKEAPKDDIAYRL